MLTIVMEYAMPFLLKLAFLATTAVVFIMFHSYYGNGPRSSDDDRSDDHTTERSTDIHFRSPRSRPTFQDLTESQQGICQICGEKNDPAYTYCKNCLNQLY